MRAAISAWIVSGIRSEAVSSAGCSTSIRIVSSTKSGLPSVLSSSAARTRGRQLVVEQRVDQLLALVGPSGSSSIAVARSRPPPQPGPDVEQLGPGEAEDHQRRVAHPLGEVLDQLEQRLLGPVDVLEDEHERLRVGELGRPLARGPGDLLRAALALDELEHPGREAEQVGDGVVAAGGAKLLRAPPGSGRRP